MDTAVIEHKQTNKDQEKENNFDLFSLKHCLSRELKKRSETVSRDKIFLARQKIRAQSRFTESRILADILIGGKR